MKKTRFSFFFYILIFIAFVLISMVGSSEIIQSHYSIITIEGNNMNIISKIIFTNPTNKTIDIDFFIPIPDLLNVEGLQFDNIAGGHWTDLPYNSSWAQRGVGLNGSIRPKTSKGIMFKATLLNKVNETNGLYKMYFKDGGTNLSSDYIELRIPNKKNFFQRLTIKDMLRPYSYFEETPDYSIYSWNEPSFITEDFTVINEIKVSYTYETNLWDLFSTIAIPIIWIIIGIVLTELYGKFIKKFIMKK